MCKSGKQRTLDDNGDFLDWFVGEPKVERAIAYEIRAPSKARLPNWLFGNLPALLARRGATYRKPFCRNFVKHCVLGVTE
jgi:hypothetical protein